LFKRLNFRQPIAYEDPSIHKSSEAKKLNAWKQKRKVMRRYDVTADMYDRRYAEEQEAKYLAAWNFVTTEGSVLDVGCGAGLLFSQVAEKADCLVGIDISKRLLFRGKPRAQEFKNVHLVQADADYLPFKGGVFHMVVTFTLLQNMPKPSTTLHEILRVANDKATIVVTGLKKAFSLDIFQELLSDVGLHLVSMIDNDVLKCYVAVTSN
jgi:ubiquinone/menaquinone biosynthesis C-methylase UbiE